MNQNWASAVVAVDSAGRHIEHRRHKDPAAAAAAAVDSILDVFGWHSAWPQPLAAAADCHTIHLDPDAVDYIAAAAVAASDSVDSWQCCRDSGPFPSLLRPLGHCTCCRRVAVVDSPELAAADLVDW